MDQSRESAAGNVGGYGDIHDNLRYWLARLVAALSEDGAIPVIYDVGANDGELSLPWAGRNIPVVAFEPGAHARERLFRRAGEAGIPGSGGALTVIPIALGQNRHRAELTVYNDDTFSSFFVRSEEEQERYGLVASVREEVEIAALDELRESRQLPAPSIIKIDVEGAERDVLLGAGETLRSARPAMIVEYSCLNCTNAGYDRREIIRILEDYGYNGIYGLIRNTDRTLHRGAILNDCRIWNLLVLPDRLLSRLPGER